MTSAEGPRAYDSWLPSSSSVVRRHVETIYRWVDAFVDPVRLVTALPALASYLRSWHTYRRLPGAERIRWRDSYPCLRDRHELAPFDAHYFYQDLWAAEKLMEAPPLAHVDIGSHLSLVGVLAAAFPVIFADIRPLVVSVPRLHSVAADGLCLPFADGSVSSMSCLHVAEHVGLGRYGDRLDVEGTEGMCNELRRVLAPGGHLLFSVPVGRPRVCFNAHRILSPNQVLGYFQGLQLVEFSAVTDRRQLVRQVEPESLTTASYACGLFQFTRRFETGEPPT